VGKVTDKDKELALVKVAELIEKEIGCRVRKVYLEQKITTSLSYLEVGDYSGAHVGAVLVYEKGDIYFRAATGIRIMVGDYMKKDFLKWNLYSSLDFEKGSRHRGTAGFLNKVRELLSYAKAKHQIEEAERDKYSRDHAYLQDWVDGISERYEGYGLVTSNGEFWLEPPTYQRVRNPSKVRIGVVSDNEGAVKDDAGESKVVVHGLSFRQSINVTGDRVDRFLKLYDALYQFLEEPFNE